MGTTTPNYGLFKPDPDPVTGDFVNVVTDINGNMDTIDTSLKAVSDNIATILKIRKTADQAVTNSVVLVPDNHLFLPVIANSFYILLSWLKYTGPADPAGGIKFDWTGPAGFAVDWSSAGVRGVGVGALTDYDVIVEAAAGTRNHGTNAGNGMTLRPSGIVSTAGVAGTLTLRWAQAAANATPTNLLTNSWIMLIKF